MLSRYTDSPRAMSTATAALSQPLPNLILIWLPPSQGGQSGVGTLLVVRPGKFAQPELVASSLNTMTQPLEDQLPGHYTPSLGAKGCLIHLPNTGVSSVLQFMFQGSLQNQAEDSL